MIKTVWLLTFCMLIVAAYGLTGMGDSDYFAMDTVAPDLILTSPIGGEARFGLSKPAIMPGQ